MLEHVEQLVPVTALAFCSDDVIISGEGQYVRAYDARTRELLASITVFDNTAVHGLIVDEHQGSTIVAWGGSLIREISLIQDEGASHAFKAFALRTTTDWILDGALSSSSDETSVRTLAMVTAHNALVVVSLEDLSHLEDAKGPSKILPIVPGSNCILYTAHIHWLSSSQCLVASGTAFGDVIVWSTVLSDKHDGTFAATTQIHYTFSAHEGSVFGVQLSSTIAPQSNPEVRGLLATCSDDRTVRIWDISDLAAEDPTLLGPQRETGFGSKATMEEHAPRCLAKAMGHISRIWHVRFTGFDPADRLQITSFGEDASTITWILKSSGSAVYDLEQTNVQRAHAGKHIWSVATAEDGRIATGGADGAIAIYNSAAIMAPPTELSEPLLGSWKSADKFKAYGFISESTIACTTEQGKVVAIDLQHDDSSRINELSSCMPNLRGYSLVTTLPGYAWLAGASGGIYMYAHEHERLFQVCTSTQKTAGLFVDYLDFSKARNEFGLLVTSVGSTTTRLLKLVPHMQSSINLVPTAQLERSLKLDPGFVVTSYTLTRLGGRNSAVLGSRDGRIAIYGIDTASEMAGTAQTSLLVLLDVHAKEAVTSLLWDSAGLTRDLTGFLHSTGRDGKHAIHRITLAEDTLQTDLVHQLSLPFGPNIEHISLRKDKTFMIWGFRSKHFVAYDVHAQREVMVVECGGAHRNFAFQPSEGGGIFVWTKASNLYRQSQNQALFGLLRSGGHGREIKSVAISSTPSQIIATGAEDTNIKLWQYNDYTGLRCSQTLRKHNTGIQHLQWACGDHYLFSSGGFEEFFVWRITADVAGIGIGVVCESSHPRSGTSDLRIMSFDVQHATVVEGREPETFAISMVYSDSTLQLWRYMTTDRSWKLCASGDYLTACLTQATSLGKTSNPFLTASMDGHITLWSQAEHDGDTVAWTQRHRVHQNAILSLMKTPTLADGSVLVLTGGDDNALGISRVTPSGRVRTLLVPRAHAAAVTGLGFVGTDAEGVSGSGKWRVVSASVDQRVKVWDVDVDWQREGVEGVDVRLVGDVHTAVADVSGLETMGLRDGGLGVLVVGVGMDVLRVG
ncbi:WD repeat-containing protein 6 [Recurvomyces mirabilis]|uniref:WD repeat-containing protein 6 n=1 Tax=Recurvomyces mirabilis TaxID=574656 RepID=A0AAE0WNX9_9PEZI|nr:WD repeat-containing protein 6 [Recurvomyces mirabilis]KAK5157888.1 WD repeat-containing protein 6 [Recurvomyces mirabilis]